MPGGTLLLKCFADDQPGVSGPYRFSPDDIRAIFAPAFDVVSIERSATTARSRLCRAPCSASFVLDAEFSTEKPGDRSVGKFWRALATTLSVWPMKRSIACIVLGIASLAACGGGGSSGGAKTTGKTGDTSNPPLIHGRADAALVAACGPGGVTAEGAAIVRAPYLQQVSDTRAMFVWTSTEPSATSVAVTRPDGTPVATAPAEGDATSHPAGARQLVAQVEALDPSSIYCYAVQQGDRVLVARTGFRTAPARGSEEPFTFMAFGDFGDGGSDQLAVFDQLLECPAQLILMLGDVAYDSGTRAQLEDNLFSVYTPLMRSLPTFPTSGNHEYETEDAAAFREFFVLPENGGPDGRERWYSFDWGSVHFVALDTEKVGPAQADWLEADLTANDLPWTVVYFHKPPYSSGMHGSDMKVRSTFGPILEAHHVNLVLCGHDHDYERVLPQNGVYYVVAGGGGHDLRDVGASGFTAFSDTVLHFVAVTVEPERMIFHAIDATGREFDSLAIPRR